MDAVMTNALGNIHNAQQEDIAQMKQGITELHKDQAKFREEMLAHLKDIKDVQARNDACHAAEEIAQIALEDGGDASKSMRRMRPHVRSLASSMKSTSLIMAYDTRFETRVVEHDENSRYSDGLQICRQRTAR